MNDDIEKILTNAKPIDENSPISKLVSTLFAACEEMENDGTSKDMSLGELLAASFDLAVTAAYARLVGSSGWISCCQDEKNELSPTLFYPFVNVCPRCLMKNKFAFVASKKPQSAQIGNVASVLIGTIFDHIVKKSSAGKCSVALLGGSGDIDAVMREGSDVCLLEIKAAPLITFPLMVEYEGVREMPDHSEVALSTLPKEQISIYIPGEKKTIPLGTREAGEDWPYEAIEDFVKNKKSFESYISAWRKVYRQYGNLDKREKNYWLTNGCGSPTPRPADWPSRRVGSGYEAISDSKSSVGLDRTDDIKKGIYQVLKLGAHFKEFNDQTDYVIRTALISNMHAVKHHDDYLKEFSDIVWSVDSPERSFEITKEKDDWRIPANKVHNLYDGLITLTHLHIRDEWLNKMMKF